MIYVERKWSKYSKHHRGYPTRCLGGKAIYASCEDLAKWKRGMPIRVRIWHKVHFEYEFGMNSDKYQRAYNRFVDNFSRMAASRDWTAYEPSQE